MTTAFPVWYETFSGDYLRNYQQSQGVTLKALEFTMCQISILRDSNFDEEELSDLIAF